MRHGRWGGLVMMALGLALAGCALAPVEGPPIQGLLPVSSSSAARDSAARAGGERTARAAAPAARPLMPADSLPSGDAQAVLATIPEPLPPGDRVPPPAPAPAPDTSAAEGDVPTPAPTRPMGDADGAPSTPPIEEAPPAATQARPDTCWRVQIGAPATPEEAEQKRQAAESLLMTAFVVELDRGLYKVRTRECVARATALAVRDRALDSGFAGTFPFAVIRQ